MKLKAGIKLYLKEFSMGASVYYGISLGLTLIGIVLATISSSNGNTNINGTSEFGMFIFMFIMGILLFTTYMKFFLQNGVSRKTIFKSGIVSVAMFSLLFSLIDTLIVIVLQKLGHKGMLLVYSSLYGGAEFGVGKELSSVSEFFFVWIWTAALYLFATFIGIITGLAFYRLTKIGRLLLGSVLGGGLIILLPIVEMTITKGAIVKSVFQFLKFIFGLQNISNPTPMMWVLSSVIICAVLGIFSFLLLRRAAPQKA